MAVSSVKPEGSRSFTTTPVALLGPLLVAVTVKVTVLPTSGVAMSTTFSTFRSAISPTSGETVEILSDKTRSSSVPVMVAVLV